MSVPRFGIWIPVYGNWAGTDPAVESHDASFSRAKKLLVEAEALGFETALLAQHLINPRDQELDQLETWTATAALGAVTERIELIAAIKPKLFHPVVLAKMALGIEDITGGRPPWGKRLRRRFMSPTLRSRRTIYRALEPQAPTKRGCSNDSSVRNCGVER
jgi:hypothetical protein